MTIRVQGPDGALVAAPRMVQFEGRVHQFPADITDAEIQPALSAIAPVQPHQPTLTPVDHDPFAVPPAPGFTIDKPAPNLLAARSTRSPRW